ncbi:transcription-repair coupling factor [Oscillospiraceae bacterium MB08-C2-2]|nr:transcription-repair coupling factor [Oscillospiraceae bacterium MB08-C2-2]
MKQFAKLLEASPEYRSLLAGIKEGRFPQMLAGLATIHKADFVFSLCRGSEKSALVVAPNEQMALRLCGDINALFGYEAAFFYPARELNFREVEGASREYEHARLRVLGMLATGECPIVVASVEGAVQYTLPREVLTARTLALEPGQAHDITKLTALLVSAGYVRCEQVEGVSQFSIRGGILDFFPPHSPSPYRVEFWGDEIDTIAFFQVDTQRRLDTVESAEILPARELLLDAPDRFIPFLEGIKKGLSGKYGQRAKEHIDRDIGRLEGGLFPESLDRYLPLLYEKPTTLFDYCTDRLLFACEPVSMKELLKNSAWQQQEDVKLLMEEGMLFKGCTTFGLDFVDVAGIFQTSSTIVMDNFTRQVPELRLAGLHTVNAVQLSSWSGEYSFLVEDLTSYMERGYCVCIFAGTPRACSALLADLTRDGFSATVIPDPGKLVPRSVFIVENSLSGGFEYPDLRLAVISQAKGVQPARKKAKRDKRGQKIKTLADLLPGDHVVHASHGIGVFEGIVKREMQGIVKDYLKIRYAGTDTLFVPVTQLDLVSKYIGASSEGGKVRLNKLNSVEWQKTRARVKAAVKDMAKELIALYAKRASAKGFAFSPDNDWQREFEERFPFEETDDQLRCIQEIKEDMQKSMPMDRLLCGDVGFGKTEVALRAAFKCVLDGKQCAVLVPTTILAWQHFQTFSKRLEGYPVTVELLSRFRSAKDQAETVRRLKRGEVDIIIGTHRVVQKDIQFKDLGLCIIDEEQRFGVAHKEKFKEMRADVDMLTLSATPIPRTLNMAMSGIRDMSTIEEAPQDRHPVQTYVLEHDMGVIAQAIQKELRRGGQVFYLHNRIESIDSCVYKLQEMIPEARIASAHGKIGEEALSRIWKQMVEQEMDILVCTTLIESGIDIPNCNTLIIEDADRMGLSQLYQLRGRVGRSTRRAYAYFTFKRGKALSEISTKRLAAIREFTAFGSGFRIAMRDLEIRGAGNILGSQQHGHMEAVGYDLYLKLLSEAVGEEKGQPASAMAGECLIDIRISAHIPEDYIDSLAQRIDVYKKIAAVTSKEDSMDVTDELIDRFGDPPEAVKGLLDVALIRNTASSLGFMEISQRDDRILMYPQVLDMELAAKAAQKLRGRVLVSAGAKPYLSVKVLPGKGPIDAIREALESMS